MKSTTTQTNDFIDKSLEDIDPILLTPIPDDGNLVSFERIRLSDIVMIMLKIFKYYFTYIIHLSIE